MANSNGWGDGASNNDIGWGKGADNAIGWGSIYADSWAGATDIVGTPAVDPDAQAFITAASITDPTQQSAINQLVVDLKGYNIWSELIALYPFIGGTSTSHSYNLKNIAVGQLTYSSGVNHGSLGIQGNNVSYANTGLRSSTMGIGLNNASAGIYVQAWTLNQSMAFGHFGNFTMYRNLSNIFPSVNNSLITTSPSSLEGFIQESRINSTQVFFKDKNSSPVTLLITSTSLNSTLDWYICKSNGYSGIDNWISLHYIAKGLTSTQLDNFYTAVQSYQTTLGRQK